MKFTKTILKKSLSLLLVLAMLMSVGLVGIGSVSAANTHVAEVSEDEGTKTIYFAPNGYWSNLFAVYVWADGAYASGEWLSMSRVADADGLYSVKIDEDYTNIIFCSRYYPANSWEAVDNKTESLTIPSGCNYLSLAGVSTAMWGVYTAQDTGFVDPAGNQTVYFVPNAEWMDIQNLLYHEFAIRAWNDANPEGTWAQFELVEGTYGTYPCVLSAEIPASFDNVEFCRIEGSIEDGVWNIWEKTDMQVVPSSSNRFTQDDAVESGAWDYYTAPEVDPDDPDATDPSETIPTTPVDPDAPVATKTIYITPNEEWLLYTADGMGSISVYSWDYDKLEGTWTWVEAVAGEENIYSAQIPQTDSNVFFGLCFGSTPDVVWGQTDDQEIPLNSNHFIHDADGATGTWTYYGNALAGNYYSVVFLNDDGKFISAQVVAEGLSAVAPQTPTKDSDAQYTYTFIGWDRSFANITSNVVVFATYSKTVNSYLVTFTDKDGKPLFAETVEYGKSATAPEVPKVEGFEFAGWDTDFTCVTSELTVKATYKKTASSVPSATNGTVKIEVAGGTGFTIAVNGGNARPQGATYLNSKMPIGVTVTVKANTSTGGEFLGWVNPITGIVVTTAESYTFTASGNDFFKAMFAVEVDGVQMVTFKNDKMGTYGRVLDAQYYSKNDEIVFPEDPTQVGFDFAGWSMTETEIKNAIAAGDDVTVVALWTRQIVKVNVTVTGGTGTGEYNANSAVTVTANEAPAGQKFAYWTDAQGRIRSYDVTYKFYPSSDTALTAVFVEKSEVINYQILVSVDSIDTVTVEGKNVFYFSWYCPEEYTFIKAGILAVNKDNYNESTFIAGTSDGNVYDRNPSGTNKAINSLSWTKSNVTSGQTWVAKAYVQYKDASGSIITVYSDVVEATKD